MTRNVAHQPNFLVPTWRRTLARVVIKGKRASAPTLLYCNSVCSFYPVLLLIHDLELNPGPPSFWGRKNQRAERSTLLSLILMCGQWLHARSFSWSSKRLFTGIIMYLSSLNPGWTLPRLITTSKFLAMSFSGRMETRINLGAGSLFTYSFKASKKPRFSTYLSKALFLYK